MLAGRLWAVNESGTAIGRRWQTIAEEGLHHCSSRVFGMRVLALQHRLAVEPARGHMTGSGRVRSRKTFPWDSETPGALLSLVAVLLLENRAGGGNYLKLHVSSGPDNRARYIP